MLAIRIAIRYLFSRKSFSAVNIICGVAIAGVALATAAMVIVLSVFNGFHDFTAQKISRVAPDLMVEAADGGVIENADSLVEAISAVPEVLAAAPIVTERAFAMAGDRQSPVTIRGIAQEGPSADAFREIIIDGSAMLLDSDETHYAAALSSVGVANALRAVPAYPVKVDLYVPRRVGRINPANPMSAFRMDSLIVSGVYRVEQSEFDTDLLVVPLSMARRLLAYTTEATSIEISAKPGVDVASMAASLKRSLPAGLTVRNRIEQQQQTFRMISVEKWVTMLMLTFILLIASFNVISTMSMLIVEKRRNQSILVAMGAPQEMLRGVYAWLCFLISAIGGVIGTVLGVGLTLAQQWGGFIKLKASDMSAMSIDVYPVKLLGGDLVAVVAIAAATGLACAALIYGAMRRTR